MTTIVENRSITPSGNITTEDKSSLVNEQKLIKNSKDVVQNLQQILELLKTEKSLNTDYLLSDKFYVAPAMSDGIDVNDHTVNLEIQNKVKQQVDMIRLFSGLIDQILLITKQEAEGDMDNITQRDAKVDSGRSDYMQNNLYAAIMAMLYEIIAIIMKAIADMDLLQVHNKMSAKDWDIFLKSMSNKIAMQFDAIAKEKDAANKNFWGGIAQSLTGLIGAGIEFGTAVNNSQKGLSKQLAENLKQQQGLKINDTYQGDLDMLYNRNSNPSRNLGVQNRSSLSESLENLTNELNLLQPRIIGPANYNDYYRMKYNELKNSYPLGSEERNNYLKNDDHVNQVIHKLKALEGEGTKGVDAVNGGKLVPGGIGFEADGTPNKPLQELLAEYKFLMKDRAYREDESSKLKIKENQLRLELQEVELNNSYARLINQSFQGGGGFTNAFLANSGALYKVESEQFNVMADLLGQMLTKISQGMQDGAKENLESYRGMLQSMEEMLRSFLAALTSLSR